MRLLKMIAKNYKKFHYSKIYYDKQISIRINSDLLQEFRKITGERYQVKIRELMQMYVDAYKRKANNERRY